MRSVWSDSDGVIGKVAEIGRIETSDRPINSRNSDVLCLSSGITSSKLVEQHNLPLSDGISAPSAAPVLVLRQQLDWTSTVPGRTF
ncbi:MAG: hypothetical protein OXN25_12470 [Candidatus Poribacteria bacterium]|nr:hypothetical protein [Candidatus Poribacteria bacterium]MYK18494.1 hypothetical protein [Candidatus Poribacteria bacterium]